MGFNLGDYYSQFVNDVGHYGSEVLKYGGEAASYFMPSYTKPFYKYLSKEGSNFMQTEIADKSDLRSAQILGLLSEFPIIGGIIRGVQGVAQMEDLYNNSGKVPAYPGLQSLGSGGIGSAAAQALHIADGHHDLYQYYAGEPDQWSIRMYQ